MQYATCIFYLEPTHSGEVSRATDDTVRCKHGAQNLQGVDSGRRQLISVHCFMEGFEDNIVTMCL